MTNSSLYLSIIAALFASSCWFTFRNQPIRFSNSTTIDENSSTSTSALIPFRKRYGDWAVVVGASEGIGAAWAHEICRMNVNVLLIARRQHELTILAQELTSKYPGIQTDILVQDLADPNLEEVIRGVLNQERKYGFLVFNAAHCIIGPFIDIPLDQQFTTIDVNIRAVLTLTHLFSNHLREKGNSGGIVLMSSLTGELGSSYVSVYAATKAWNTNLAHSLSFELSQHNIDILACVAGATTTPSYLEKTAEKSRNRVLESTPDQVASECIQAVGAQYSIRTGALNKFFRFLLVKILPLGMAVDIFNHNVVKQFENDP